MINIPKLIAECRRRQNRLAKQEIELHDQGQKQSRKVESLLAMIQSKEGDASNSVEA